MEAIDGAFNRLVLAGMAAIMLTHSAHAGDSEQARRIYDRIAGVPPTAAVMVELESAMAGTNAECATFALTGNDPAKECVAYLAMKDVNFYNVTLKNFAAPWTNRDQSVFVPLNDYIATVIGMIRDDIPFNELLSRDIIYVGRDGNVPFITGAFNPEEAAKPLTECVTISALAMRLA